MADPTNPLAKYDDLFNEIRLRLINTENKVNVLMGALSDEYRGHTDQRYGHLTYSQHGEDLVFVALMERLGVEAPTYLDVGANHPVFCSNTYLLHKRGARGVNIDASPDVIELFRRMRPEDRNLNVGVGASSGKLNFYRIGATSGRNSFSRETIDQYLAQHPHERLSDTIEVPVLTLDEVVDQQFGGRYPDLVSIDAEGLDYDILAAAKFATRPKVLCVETLSASGDLEAKLDALLTARGFRRCINMFANAIYLDRDLAA